MKYRIAFLTSIFALSVAMLSGGARADGPHRFVGVFSMLDYTTSELSIDGVTVPEWPELSVQCERGCESYSWKLTDGGALLLVLDGSRPDKRREIEVGQVDDGYDTYGSLASGHFTDDVVQGVKYHKGFLRYPCIDDGFSDMLTWCRKDKVELELRTPDGERIAIGGKYRVVRHR